MANNGVVRLIGWIGLAMISAALALEISDTPQILKPILLAVLAGYTFAQLLEPYLKRR